jgi:hypothetical protein
MRSIVEHMYIIRQFPKMLMAKGTPIKQKMIKTLLK